MGVENISLKLFGIDYATNSVTALRHQERAFRRARQSIRIVETRAPEVAGLEEAVKRGCPVEVVVGPRLDAWSLRSLTRLGATVYELEEPPTQRFTVIDEKHLIGHSRTEQYIVRNFNHTPEYLDLFDALKGRARAVF